MKEASRSGEAAAEVPGAAPVEAEPVDPAPLRQLASFLLAEILPEGADLELATADVGRILEAHAGALTELSIQNLFGLVQRTGFDDQGALEREVDFVMGAMTTPELLAQAEANANESAALVAIIEGRKALARELLATTGEIVMSIVGAALVGAIEARANR